MKIQMKLATVFVAGIFYASSAFAQSSGQLKIQISNLAQEISFEVRSSDLAIDKLIEVRDRLSDLVSVIKEPVRTEPSEECLDFAFRNYNQSYSSDTAMNEAMSACREITELEIAKYIFSKAYLTFNAAGAMDIAAKHANRELRGKIEILEYAYEAYFKSLSSGASISTAAEKSAQVQASSLGCLRYSYERRYRSVSSAEAMNGAFADCR